MKKEQAMAEDFLAFFMPKRAVTPRQRLVCHNCDHAWTGKRRKCPKCSSTALVLPVGKTFQK